MVAGPQNQTDSLYRIVNGLVGNVDWGESLSVVAYKFPGLNGFIPNPKLWSTETVDAQLSFSSKF